MKSLTLQLSRSSPAGNNLPVALIFALLGLVLTFALIGSGYSVPDIDMIGP